jgi:hypothetical protein
MKEWRTISNVGKLSVLKHLSFHLIEFVTLARAVDAEVTVVFEAHLLDKVEFSRRTDFCQI